MKKPRTVVTTVVLFLFMNILTSAPVLSQEYQPQDCQTQACKHIMGLDTAPKKAIRLDLKQVPFQKKSTNPTLRTLALICLAIVFIGSVFIVKKHNKFDRDMPEIPGTLYSVPISLKGTAIFILSLMLITAALYIQGMTDIWWMFVLLPAALIYELIRARVEKVYVSENNLKITFSKGRKIQDGLENYYLKIGSQSGRSYSTYTYTVRLINKDLVGFTADGEETIAPPLKLKKGDLRRHPIPLSDNFFNPKNLKDWVRSFQAQIESPLPVIFESEQVQKDFETGVFKA